MKKENSRKAAALTYEPSSDDAPWVAAKGTGAMAERIIALAQEKGIPIKEDPDLVDVLCRLDWYQEIPVELYQVVAEVLAFAYEVNAKAKG